jgi:hypothetical protein
VLATLTRIEKSPCWQLKKAQLELTPEEPEYGCNLAAHTYNMCMNFHAEVSNCLFAF